MDNQLPAWVKAGAFLKFDYGKDHPDEPTLYEVRGLVDGRAVLRERSDSRGWIYTVESAAWFESFERRLLDIKQAAQL